MIDSTYPSKSNETYNICGYAGTWYIGVAYDGTFDNSNFYIKVFESLPGICVQGNSHIISM